MSGETVAGGSQQLLADLEPARGTRVLVLAPEPANWCAELREAGLLPEAPDDWERLDLPPDHFGAAILDGVLDRSEWDRWLLQQVWRCLKEGAGLALRAGNRWSLASPRDALRLAGRVRREFGRRVRRSLLRGSSDSGERFHGHAYSRPQITRLLSRVGFEVRSCEPEEPGLLAPLSALPAAARFGASWRVAARKRVLGAVGGSVPVPSCAEHRAAFEAQNTPFLEARNAWLARYGRDAAGARERFDPGAFGGSPVLVLSPHPDDEIIGCGGTLLRLVRAGAQVTCVQATDGSDAWALRHAPESARRSVRLEEARAVAAAAGFAHLEEWREDNRKFLRSDPLVARLAELLAQLRPRLVFAPFLADVHPDHLTLNRILGEALSRAGSPSPDTCVLGYEVWSKAPPDWICDVTEVRAEQEALLWKYPTAMKTDDFIRLCEERNYYNACVYLERQGYAEIFHVVEAASFPGLAERTLSS